MKKLYNFDARIELPIKCTGYKETDKDIIISFDFKKAKKDFNAIQKSKLLNVLLISRGWKPIVKGGKNGY